MNAYKEQIQEVKSILIGEREREGEGGIHVYAKNIDPEKYTEWLNSQ